MANLSNKIYKVFIAVFGGIAVLIGLILSLPLVPGPGILLVFLGITLLSTQYDWARKWRDWLKAKLKRN